METNPYMMTLFWVPPHFFFYWKVGNIRDPLYLCFHFIDCIGVEILLLGQTVICAKTHPQKIGDDVVETTKPPQRKAAFCFFLYLEGSPFYSYSSQKKEKKESRSFGEVST